MSNEEHVYKEQFKHEDHTILVVDDNPANLSVIIDYLADCGFQVIVARTGETAIELAASELPDLILLDVMLTGIDGFETCRRLKADNRTRHIMVIFMTVLTETANKVMGFDLGAVDYITKPFQQDELLARVTTHLRLKDLTFNLEKKVYQQTGDLIASNRKLNQQIAESRKIEAALRESESRYRAAIENSNDGIAIIEEGRYVYINGKLLEILGYDTPDKLLGKNVGSIFHADDRDRILHYNRLREAGGPAPAHYEAKGVTQNGDTLFLDVSATRINYQDRIAVLAFFKNITKRKQLEVQLQQAQKMEAIGTLAGGIAHDFNNILSIIIGHTELAVLDEEVRSDTRNHLEQVLSAGGRASELVQQILMFSRQKDLERKPLQLRLLVKEGLKLMRASLPSTIQITLDLKDHHSMILADATQIQQVLMNLCANAVHAIPNQQGEIRVILEPVNVDSLQSPHLKPGPYLKLSVADNGHGMERSILNRIFDPYFSTKHQGEGTGLGLAVVHGIITSYKGEIQVHSRPGQGTRFDILLPVTQNHQPANNNQILLEDLPSGTEHILYVDDEAMIVEIYEGMLKHLGYEVTAMTSSIEAWRLFETQPHRFDLVITDMTMPQLTGDVLSARILKLRPDIPIILCTGYSDRLSQQQANIMGIKKYLKKPVVIQQLAGAIREALDARQP